MLLLQHGWLLVLTQAKMYLSSVRTKERAFQELKNWTNELKSMVAAGVENFPDDPPGGHRISLKEDSKGNTIIEGKLHKNIRRAGSSGQYSIYYNIDTYITWKNNKFFFISEVLDTLRFNTYQIKFHIQ